jgi:hypothetical protein
VFNKAKGVTLPVDNRPLPGSKKRKARATPVAAAAVADTPVATVAQRLDFTFENAWLARVTHGLSQQEVGDMLAGSLGPYARAKKAGVPFPDIPGGFDSLTMANFGGILLQRWKLWQTLPNGVTRVTSLIFSWGLCSLPIDVERSCCARIRDTKVGDPPQLAALEG